MAAGVYPTQRTVSSHMAVDLLGVLERGSARLLPAAAACPGVHCPLLGRALACLAGLPSSALWGLSLQRTSWVTDCGLRFHFGRPPWPGLSQAGLLDDGSCDAPRRRASARRAGGVFGFPPGGALVGGRLVAGSHSPSRVACPCCAGLGGGRSRGALVWGVSVAPRAAAEATCSIWAVRCTKRSARALWARAPLGRHSAPRAHVGCAASGAVSASGFLLLGVGAALADVLAHPLSGEQGLGATAWPSRGRSARQAAPPSPHLFRDAIGAAPSPPSLPYLSPPR